LKEDLKNWYSLSEKEQKKNGQKYLENNGGNFG